MCRSGIESREAYYMYEIYDLKYGRGRQTAWFIWYRLYCEHNAHAKRCQY